MKIRAITILAAALCGVASASTVSLDGEWDFKYVGGGGKTIAAERKMPVPACWEMHGAGKLTYGGNKATTVPEESGIYRRSFITPDDFRPGSHAFLRFEGVMFGAEVKVNGKVAGTFRSSFNRNTLEVTELLKAAGEENALEVATLMQPKGGAFDTNDDWTFHGIYRSVMLDVRPAVYLKDWTVAVKDGKVTVKTEVAGDGSVEHNLPVTVAGSRLWSAENPVRHDVLFTVRDAKGRVTETVKAKVGLREVTWSGRELKVNGKRVWLDGVNHHDICPCHGRAITDEEQWRDVKMIKDAGMNFIRCCHYPPSTALLDACDALGVYVLDEVPFGFGDKLLYDESYGEVLEERVRLTIARDKNRASVVIWAIGNENPVTRITIAAGRLAGELDPTRPWTFPMIPGAFKAWVTGTDKFAPGNGDIPPVYDWHYPNDGDIPEYMDKVDRPVIASEWGHAFGSETGSIEAIYKAMRSWPECHGGAIWMFQDQGVERKAADCGERERRESAWKDTGTIWDTHGIAGTDGLVYSDRTPQTGWYQICALFGGKGANGGKYADGRKFGVPEKHSPQPPAFAIRFDRRMTITKRTALASGEASRTKRDAALAKGKKWSPGRKEADVKDLVSPRIQPAGDGEVKIEKEGAGYLVSYSFSRAAALDSSEAGVCFTCPPQFRSFRWEGMGPFEVYPLRDALDSFGKWAIDKDDLYFPGNRMGVTRAEVSDASGAGWRIEPLRKGETLNVAVENAPDGGIRLCVNAFVCGTYQKRDWPKDMRHVEAGEKIEGAFRLVHVSGCAPAPTPFKPFLRNYDSGDSEE